MLDTIILRLHDLQKHDVFVNAIMKINKGVKISESVINKNENESFLRVKYLDFLHEQKSFVSYKGVSKLPSSHYDLVYMINRSNDCIEFNFSIPKLIYGMNVIQFVPHVNEMESFFSLSEISKNETLLKIVYKRLRKFIKLFFDWIYPDCEKNGYVDFRKLEIARIDFCYNQFFNDLDDAMTYLSYQKRLKKKFSRENYQGQQTYKTSVFYSTDRYSCKIYHKGTEYQKNDKKKHEKINAQFRSDKVSVLDNKKLRVNEPIFKISDFEQMNEYGELKIIEGIQSIANKILRYEMTFRKSYISYLYRMNIWRNKSEMWNKYKIEFQKDKLIRDQIKRALENNKGELYLKLMEKLKKRTRVENNMSQAYEQLVNQRVKFCLNVDNDTNFENNNWTPLKKTKTGWTAINEAKFDFDIFKLMFEQFINFFNDFQIEEKVNLSDFQNRIKDFNTKVKNHNKHFTDEQPLRKINNGGLSQMVLLLQYHSLDEIKAMNVIPIRTFYYYKSKLKKLDLLKNNVSEVNIQCTKDYEKYQNLVFSCPDVMRIKNYFFK